MTLDEATCRRLCASARVARLATVGDDGRPHLVPIVFALDGDTIVHAVDQKPKRSRRLRRVRNLEAEPRASVLVDHYDERWDRLWWVRADGLAEVVEDPASVAAGIAALQRRYPQYVADPPRGPVILLTVDRWTGWAASAAAIGEEPTPAVSG